MVDIDINHLSEAINDKTRAKNIIGHTFGRLTVIKRVENNKYNKAQWLCKCKCGNEIIVVGTELRNGHTKSCGCLHKETIFKGTNTKHGYANTKLYKVWLVMKDRCLNKNNKSYINYGQRGIAICKEWKEDFNTFYEWSILNGYKEGLTIDRIDNNGNYEPSNCRWVTRHVQNNNMRRNKRITINGRTQNLSQWCKELNLKYDRIKDRLYKLGWTIEKAFELEVNNG